MLEVNFHSEALKFLENLFADMSANKIQIESHWDIDHLCFRADTIENYDLLKNQFTKIGKLLIASDVNGREISTYELTTPVLFNGRSIQVVELPAPKKGKDTPMGFEHIEIVCDQPFSELMNKYSYLKLDSKGMEKSFNKELEICLGTNNLKFHQLSLKSVINLEKNQKVFKAVESSEILKKLSKYNPLIAGTFPLDLQIEESDIDVILTTSDLDALSETLKSEFGNYEEFSFHKNTVDGLESLICNFVIEGIPFEVFAQNKESVRQNAYLHFLIEERLLKIGGDSFRAKVLKERTNGLKTEPAFAKVLNLQEDPYRALLELQTKDDAYLEAIIGKLS